MTVRRAVGAALLVCTLAVGGVACSSSKDTSGATTNLDDIGPQLARLRLEVQQLREEVKSLRDEVASVTGTSSTLPGSGSGSGSTDTTTGTTTTG